MKNRNFKMVSAFMLLAVSLAWGLTRMNSLAIWNSTIDNTVIGGATAAAANFTSVGVSGNENVNGQVAANSAVFSTSVIASTMTATTFNGSLNGNAASASNVPYSNLTGPVPTWNQNTTGSAGHVPYTGLTGSATTWNQNTTGNAATATALAASPSNCGSQRYPSGVNASGAAQNCGPQTLYGTTSSVCSTPSGAGTPTNTCTTNVSWVNGSFTGGSYYATCTGLNASGTTAPVIFITGKSSTFVTVSLMAGTASQAGAGTYSEIDCVGMQP